MHQAFLEDLLVPGAVPNPGDTTKEETHSFSALKDLTASEESQVCPG